MEKITAEFPDISEMAKSELTVNGMPLEEFVMKVDEATHYLDVEIQNTENIELTDTYDGVRVGFKESEELRKHHIWFCEQILDLLGALRLENRDDVQKKRRNTGD